MPMANDSSSMSSESSTRVKEMKRPKSSTLSFIRQFAHSYVSVNGCRFGNMVLN